MDENLLSASPSSIDERPEIIIHPQCGACGRRFQDGEKITSLTCSDNVCQSIDSGSYSEDLHNQSRDPRIVIHPESVTCHADCFNLVVKNTDRDGPRKLWIVGSWRYPWDRCQPLLLPPPEENTGSYMESCMSLAEEKCEIPFLPRFPVELRDMIFRLCGPLLLWRYESVLQLVQELGSAQTAVESAPLNDISHWHRGSQPVISPAEGKHFTRVTIDARGVQQIKRVTEETEETDVRSRHLLYIFENATDFENITVDFQNGLARLRLAENQDLRIWDIPTPPKSFCVARVGEELDLDRDWMPNQMPMTPCFRSSDLKECNAITFFVSPKGIFGLHGHTSRRPYAIETFNDLPRRVKPYTAWVYHPLGVNDEISSIGFEYKKLPGGRYGGAPCLWVSQRRELVGTIGFPIAGEALLSAVRTEARPALFFDHGSGIRSPYMAVARSGKLWHDVKDVRINTTDAYLSSASLEGVSSVSVFYDDNLGFCRGILFAYADETKRAVGECRLGQDTALTYDKPIGLYYTNAEVKVEGLRFLRPALYVIVATEKCPKPEKCGRPTWAHTTMKGAMGWGFTHNDSWITIAQGNDDQ